MDTRGTSAATQAVERLFAPPGQRFDGVEPSDELAALRHEVRQLREGLLSRAVIDQAKGMLMARYGISDDRGFEVLAGWSQKHNVKVRVLAAAMVADAEGGELAPESPAIPDTDDGYQSLGNPGAGVR